MERITRGKAITKSERYRLSKLGEKNPNWKGENACSQSGRLRAENWFPNPKPCEICNSQKSERHHKDGNTLNNDPGNIQWLCRKHHMVEDGRMENWIKNPHKNTNRDQLGRFASNG